MTDDRTFRVREQRLDAAARQVRLPAARVRHFIRVGLIRPSHVEGRTVYIDEVEMARLRKIRRLRDDLGLDMAGIEVALRLLDEIDALRTALGKRPADGRRTGRPNPTQEA